MNAQIIAIANQKGGVGKTTTGEKLRKYFPKRYTPRQMEETIFKLLEGWAKRRDRAQER